jgi:hypothetical protein
VANQHRIREMHRHLEAVAAPFGATVSTEITKGSHVRVIFTMAGRHACIIVSSSPRDSFEVKRRASADARRVLRGLS